MVNSVIESLKDAIKEISRVVKTAETGKVGSRNVYGEEQLALDVISDRIIQGHLNKNDNVGLLASEELPEEIAIGDGEFAVCYDPLDGSSLVDVNLAVGSIFGVYKTSTFIGRKGSEMLASMFAVYGPRTTMVITTGDGVMEYTLRDEDFVLTKEDIKITNQAKMFAPGNLRACKTESNYVKLMEYYMREQYTLRYSGGMVPDINQILLKGQGIFTYPSYVDAPHGKLRLLFECAPMAMLVEQAGGSATNGNSQRILDIIVSKLSQRTPIFIGASEEVETAEKFLNS